MNILVTGGAGFIGTNLIKRLLKDGHSVVSLDNYSTGLHTNHQAGAVYVNADIRNLEEHSDAFWQKFDVVYHLAAIARIQPSFEDPYSYFTTNANATFKLAKYCSDNNIPLGYVGLINGSEITYCVHHEHKNKGVGTFMVKSFSEDFRNMSAVVKPENIASQKVFEKLNWDKKILYTKK
jgi:NAD dependent epimerase/dehydratase family enzyme